VGKRGEAGTLRRRGAFASPPSPPPKTVAEAASSTDVHFPRRQVEGGSNVRVRWNDSHGKFETEDDRKAVAQPGAICAAGAGINVRIARFNASLTGSYPP